MKRTVSAGATRVIGAVYISLFALFTAKIIITGDVYDYVHPRFIPFLAGGAILSALIVIAMLAKSRDARPARFSYLRIAILLIPIILAFTIRPAIVDATGDERFSKPASKAPAASGKAMAIPTDGVPPQIADARKSASVTLDDDRYFIILQDIYDNPSYYDGKGISLVAKILRKKTSPPDECAVARMLMTCCAADLQPAGFMCVCSGASALDRSKWYLVRGTIRLSVIDGEKVPVIKADSLAETAKPATEYVYPIM